MPAVESSDAYQRVLNALEGHISLKKGRGPVLLEALCGDCYAECERVICREAKKGADQGMNAAALDILKAEVERLKDLMTDCNKTSLRQVAALSSSVRHESENDVHFYEPLKYLEPRVRAVVMDILAYKFWQLEKGSAPPWLMERLQEKMEVLEVAKPEDEADEDDLVERHATQGRRRLSKDGDVGGTGGGGGSSDEEEGGGERTQHRFEQAMERQKTMEETMERKDDEIADLLRANAELRRLSASQASEIEALQREENFRLAADQEEEVEKELQRLPGDRDCSMGANAPGADGRCVDVTCADSSRRTGTGRSRRDSTSQYHAEDAKAFCDASGNARGIAREGGAGSALAQMSRHTQTTLTGENLATLQENNARLKVTLEEVKEKFGDLMQEGKKMGINSTLDHIVDKVGLKPLLRSRGVFEKLYRDAFDRIERLEKLREKHRRERQGALSDLVRVCTARNMPLPPNILEAVQRSQLMYLLSAQEGVARQPDGGFAQDAPAANEVAARAAAPRRPSQSHVLPEIATPEPDLVLTALGAHGGERNQKKEAQPLPPVSSVQQHQRERAPAMRNATSLPTLGATARRSGMPLLMVSGLDPAHRGKWRKL